MRRRKNRRRQQNHREGVGGGGEVGRMGEGQRDEMRRDFNYT